MLLIVLSSVFYIVFIVRTVLQYSLCVASDVSVKTWLFFEELPQYNSSSNTKIEQSLSLRKQLIAFYHISFCNILAFRQIVINICGGKLITHTISYSLKLYL